jgi:hypothetical protein
MNRKAQGTLRQPMEYPRLGLPIFNQRYKKAASTLS